MRVILVAAAFVLAAAVRAQGTDEQSVACADDYRTYCAAIPPDDQNGILACFKKHRKDLRDACRKMIDAPRKKKK